jgi:hypothetical protein
VTFRNPGGRLVQLYWWQLRGLYVCGAYDADSGAMLPIGSFATLDAAVACALAG